MFSSACSVDAESVPEPHPARCIDSASSPSTTSSLSSPSPGSSMQSGHPLGSAQGPLAAAVAGRNVTVAFSPANFSLLHGDLFSMAWHNPTALGCQLLWPVALSCLQLLRRLVSITDGFRWRGDPVSPTTFYPCEHWRSSPDALYVYRHGRKTLRRRTHLYDGVLRRPRMQRGASPGTRSKASPRLPPALTPLLAAPLPVTPRSKGAPSAMSNLRATATIPIRLKRLPHYRSVHATTRSGHASAATAAHSRPTPSSSSARAGCPPC